MSTQETIALFDQYVLGNYARTPIAPVRGQGTRFWDAEEREYLDLFPGWGVNLLGYCHPVVVKAVQEQAARMLHVDNSLYIPEQGRLAQMLIERLGFPAKAFFCNSGAEANEAAIKIMRRYQSEKAQKGSSSRYKIITMHKGFHGRTYGAMSATAQAKIHKGFDPLVPGFVYVPWNDLAAVEKAMDDTTAGILLEPIQGEGGVNVPPDDYLPGLRALCDQHGLCLAFDEVQCGSGRTGKWYGFQNWNVTPDIVSLAKGLGGGVAIGGVLVKPELAAVMTPGSHGSTFGGNPLAAAAAMATIEAIESENLLQNGVTVGNYLQEKLTALKSKFNVIDHVRGLGMMIGVQLKSSGVEVAKKALGLGLRINCTQDTVLRLLPSLALTTAEADEGLDKLTGALQEVYPG